MAKRRQIGVSPPPASSAGMGEEPYGEHTRLPVDVLLSDGNGDMTPDAPYVVTEAEAPCSSARGIGLRRPERPNLVWVPLKKKITRTRGLSVRPHCEEDARANRRQSGGVKEGANRRLEGSLGMPLPVDGCQDLQWLIGSGHVLPPGLHRHVSSPRSPRGLEKNPPFLTRDRKTGRALCILQVHLSESRCCPVSA